MTMHLDISELEEARDDWMRACDDMYRGLHSATYEAGLAGRGAARNRAPVRTHNLENNIEVVITLSTGTRVTVRVKTNTSYAKFVLEGMNAFDISGKLMAFQSGGSMVFTRKVHIPARAGNDFISPSGNEAEAELDSRVDSLLNSAFSRFL